MVSQNHPLGGFTLWINFTEPTFRGWFYEITYNAIYLIQNNMYGTSDFCLLCIIKTVHSMHAMSILCHIQLHRHLYNLAMGMTFMHFTQIDTGHKELFVIGPSNKYFLNHYTSNVPYATSFFFKASLQLILLSCFIGYTVHSSTVYL